MGYKLEIALKASEHLDLLLAAKNILSGIEEIYDRLEEDPWQFTACIDYVLRKKEYRKAKIPGMA